MNIDRVAVITGVSKSKIRYYEDINLINIGRKENGYRDFKDEDIQLIKIISDLKMLNLNLDDIKYIISLFQKPVTKECNAESQIYLKNLIITIKKNIEDQQQILCRIERIQKMSENMKYEENKNEILNELSRWEKRV
ncbi:MerR family transcriptional regulator [Staphylococcus pasteuri]|uniref:MerR family transcriptional regulator n=1 Tax=Staphylococcus pasteuri TaxID=45972 RepID=UPI003261561B